MHRSSGRATAAWLPRRRSLADSDPNLRPGIDDSLPLGTAGAVEDRGIRGRPTGEGLKSRVRADPRVAQRLVPDTPGPLPSIPAELCGDEVEGMVWDPRVDMHSTLVLEGTNEIAHVRRLGVFPEHWVVERGARRLHRAERIAVEAGTCEQLGSNQPIRLGS